MLFLFAGTRETVSGNQFFSLAKRTVFQPFQRKTLLGACVTFPFYLRLNFCCQAIRTNALACYAACNPSWYCALAAVNRDFLEASVTPPPTLTPVQTPGEFQEGESQFHLLCRFKERGYIRGEGNSKSLFPYTCLLVTFLHAKKSNVLRLRG